MTNRCIVDGQAMNIYDKDGFAIDRLPVEVMSNQLKVRITGEVGKALASARRLCDNAEVVGTHARVNLDDLNALREALDRLQTPIG